MIRQDVSPEQVSARLKLEDELSISHETLYQYLYADKLAGGDLWGRLRCQKPRRKRYASGQERRGTIRNRVRIDEPPEISSSRKLVLEIGKAIR